MIGCDLCGKEKNLPHTCKVYTGEFKKKTSTKTGFKQYNITTSYTNIEEHAYHFCRWCFIKWNILIPLVGYFLIVLMVKGFLLPYERWVAAFFLSFFPAVIVAYVYLILPRHLIRVSLRRRFYISHFRSWFPRQVEGEPEIKGFMHRS